MIFRDFKAVIGSAFRKPPEYRNEDFGKQLFIGAVFLAGISTILTVLNILKGWWFMTGTTTVLTMGFVISAVLTRKSCNLGAMTIMAIMTALIFSIYIVTGENEGFACLWALLVPVIGMSLLGLGVGTVLGLYYQVFLIVLFYTPLRAIVAGKYTETFLMRFPILYFATFGAVTILAAQKQFYLDKTVDQAYHDGLTGLNNRNSYIEKLSAYDGLDDLVVIAIDLNRLKHINDSYGHDRGDRALSRTADCLKTVFPADAFLARTGGDEFTVLMQGDSSLVLKLKEELLTKADECRIDGMKLSLAVGYACRKDHPAMDINGLAREADRMMYREKMEFYRLEGYDPR